MPLIPDASALGGRPVPQPDRPRVAYEGGARLGTAVSGAGRAMAEVADKLQREDDANAVFAARRQLDDWERGAIFDPENGAANKRGSAAFGVPDELGKSFDETAGKIAEGLTTDRQRAAFRELATSRRAQVLDWGSKHAQREREVYEVGQFKAELDSMAERAALFPDRAAGELDLARQRIIGFMRGKGRSTEEIEQAVKEQASRTHDFVLRSMVNAGNAEQASEYLKKNRGDMTAEAVLRAENGLKETTARIRAQGFADEVFAAGMTPRQAEDEARKRFSGGDEVAAIAELRDRFARDLQIKKQEQDQASEAAWSVITNGGGRRQIAPDLWNRLSPQDQRQINDYTEARWRRAKADAEGKDIKTNLGEYAKLLRMPNDEFAGVRLEMYADRISRGDLKTLMDRQERIREPKEAKKLFTEEQMIAGYRTVLKVDTNSQEWGQFLRTAQDTLAGARERKGSDLNEKEIRAELDRLVIEGEVASGSMFLPDKDKRYYQLTPEERAKFAAGAGGVPTLATDIPAADRAALVAGFRARGVQSPSSEQLLRAWQRMQRSGGAGGSY